MYQTTCYPAAYSLRSFATKSILKALTTFMSTFGIPKVIQSDQGLNFMSKQFSKALHQLRVSHCHGSWVPGPILTVSCLCVCVCVCVSRCLWVCVIEADSLQLRVITVGLYLFLSRSLLCQILAVFAVVVYGPFWFRDS